MIELKIYQKSFNGVEVLKDISITYQRGKTNLIIGASGFWKKRLNEMHCWTN